MKELYYIDSGLKTDFFLAYNHKHAVDKFVKENPPISNTQPYITVTNTNNGTSKQFTCVLHPVEVN